MNPDAPAFKLPSGAMLTLPYVDGHPDRFGAALLALERCGMPLPPALRPGVTSVAGVELDADTLARWRYTLDAGGCITRIDRAATPNIWTPHHLPSRNGE